MTTLVEPLSIETTCQDKVRGTRRLERPEFFARVVVEMISTALQTHQDISSRWIRRKQRQRQYLYSGDIMKTCQRVASLNQELSGIESQVLALDNTWSRRGPGYFQDLCEVARQLQIGNVLDDPIGSAEQLA